MDEFYVLARCNTPEGEIHYAPIHELRSVFNASEDDIELAYNNQRWNEARVKRDKLLAETDHWAYQDTSDMTQEQIDYRQALRDITNQEDPDNIVWPDKPL